MPKRTMDASRSWYKNVCSKNICIRSCAIAGPIIHNNLAAKLSSCSYLIPPVVHREVGNSDSTPLSDEKRVFFLLEFDPSMPTPCAHFILQRNRCLQVFSTYFVFML